MLDVSEMTRIEGILVEGFTVGSRLNAGSGSRLV